MMIAGAAGPGPGRGEAGISGMNMQSDSVSRELQKRIGDAQKELQQLSTDKEMSPEDKAKKSQEIRQEITSLNQQLRQHQMEQRKEQQSKRASENGDFGEQREAGKAKAGGRENGISRSAMKAMISADSAVKQAKVQSSVAVEMEDRADVLKSEIRQDGGGSTEKKEADLAEAEQRAAQAKTAQVSTLTAANHTLKEASEVHEDKPGADGREEDNAPKADVYTPVDIRL